MVSIIYSCLIPIVKNVEYFIPHNVIVDILIQTVEANSGGGRSVMSGRVSPILIIFKVVIALSSSESLVLLVWEARRLKICLVS